MSVCEPGSHWMPEMPACALPDADEGDDQRMAASRGGCPEKVTTFQNIGPTSAPKTTRGGVTRSRAIRPWLDGVRHLVQVLEAEREEIRSEIAK